MENITLINVLAAIGAITVIFLVVKFILSLASFGLFMTANFSGAKVSLLELIFMKIRKVDVKAVINAYIQLIHNKINVELAELEVAYLAGLNIEQVTKELIDAKKKNEELSIKEILNKKKKDTDLIE